MGRLANLKQQKAERVDQAERLHNAIESDEVDSIDAVDSVEEARELRDEALGEAENLQEEIDDLEESRKKLERLGVSDEDTGGSGVGERAFDNEDRGDDMNLNVEVGEPTMGPTETRDAINRWGRDGPYGLSNQERELITGKSPNEIRLYRTETRSTALVKTSPDADGGAIVPTEMFDQIFGDVQDRSEVRNIAATMNTETGRSMEVPLRRDATAQGEIVGEGSTIASTTSIRFGQVTFDVHDYRSGPILASFQQLQDAAFDVPDLIRDEAGIRIGNAQAQDFVSNSTGTTGPDGIETATTGAVTMGAGSTNLTLDKLQTLKNSVHVSWRMGGDPRWLMSPEAWEAVQKLEDADGRPLWQQSIRDDVPARLLGAPVHVDSFVASSTGANNKPIFYGVFDRQGAYVVRDVNQMVIRRFDEKFQNEGAIGFQAFMRSGGRPLFATTNPSRKPYRALLTT